VSLFQEKEKRGEMITKSDNIKSFDVIIFHSPQMLSFLSYHFS
jgi:hypothetical protein